MNPVAIAPVEKEARGLVLRQFGFLIDIVKNYISII